MIFSLAMISLADAGGSFLLQVVDGESGEPVPVRIVLSRENGTRAPIRRAVDAGVGVVIDGEVELSLAPNTYRFEISRGPEYRVTSGSFTLDRDSEDSRTLELSRIADLASEGWVAGDVMAAVHPRHAGTLMASESLPVAGLLSRSDAAEPPVLAEGYFARSDLIRGGGEAAGLLAIGLTPEESGVKSGESSPEAPSSDFLRTISRAASAVDPPRPPRWIIANPLAWDVPIWLSSGRIDGVVVLGDFLQLDQKQTTIPGSRVPTKLEFREPRGLGRWAEHVYWQMLEAGLHPVPAAASGAGLVANPIGYNRVYVHLGTPASGSPSGPAAARLPSGNWRGNWTGEDWWSGFWGGRTVVTNGPLLRPTLDGFPPGHRFEARAGETLELTPQLRLAIRDPVDYLDVIRNGQIVYHARLDEFAKAGGMIPALRFEQSGWVAIRVMTKYESHYRAAISAPWFVVFDGTPRISSRGVAFFNEWLAEREQMLREASPEMLKRHVPYVRAARQFWQQRAEAANAP